MRHDDFVWGNCRELRGTYSYGVDFGEGLCCNEGEGSFATPFVCGDVVVSAIRQWSRSAPHNKTQARSLTTGRLLGRRDGAALRGSTCVDGKRALLVGKRDIQIVSVPLLHRLWQQKQDSEIGAVAVSARHQGRNCSDGEPRCGQRARPHGAGDFWGRGGRTAFAAAPGFPDRQSSAAACATSMNISRQALVGVLAERVELDD